MAEATVSAVIVALDAEAYVAEALDSVLAQTRPCRQVVVVDNGSTDRTLEIVRSYGAGIDVVAEHRRGVGFARNAGIRAASGDYAGFLDADDTWEPGKTERQLAAFEYDPGLDLVFGHARQFLSPEVGPELATRVRVPDAPQPGLHLGAMLGTRAAWGRVGPWEAGHQASDGLAWLLQARQLGLRREMLPDLVLNRRIHGANLSMRNHESRSEWARLLKASLDERRAARPGDG